MLRIDRIRIEIQTGEGLYGFDERLYDGLNFLASGDNTCGKSSILAAIYYGLGFEEIIGGRGEKVLSSAYKTYIESGGKRLAVLEAKVYLQISNGEEPVVLYRAAKMDNRDTRLITVYHSELDRIGEAALIEDTYVHMPNAAVNAQGFHRFLEKFLNLELPEVLATDGSRRKLYLQLVFSCMFIEQKHGWSDFFSGMPFLAIKDAKKRVLEFVLKLDTYENEEKKDSQKVKEVRIRSRWEFLVKEVMNACRRETCEAAGMLLKPCAASETELAGMHVLKEKQNIDDYINRLQSEYEKIEDKKPKMTDNFEELQGELDATEELIAEYEGTAARLRERIRQEKAAIRVLDDNLEIIENDLRNNKDAKRLKNLGSELGCLVSEDICPVCHQPVKDSLLPNVEGAEVMSIDANIRHLEAQKIMLLYAKESHRHNRDRIDEEIQNLQAKTAALRRLAKTLRSDLYAVDESLSETLVYKKVELQARIERLEELKAFVEGKKRQFRQMSEEWKEYMDEKSQLPQSRFSVRDEEKIKLLRKKYVRNLEIYGYKSVTDMKEIEISTDNYLPMIKGFDMKFDSSASDGIRCIWAYTMALLQVSMEKGGSHPAVLIFDEPKQHSIVPEDMEKFFESILQLGTGCQTIIGITVKDIDTKNTIEKLDKGTYHIVNVKNKAFQKLDI